MAEPMPIHRPTLGGVPGEPYAFTVRSRSRPNACYRVDWWVMADGSLGSECECEAYQFGNRCWHRDEVEAFLEQTKEFQAMTAETRGLRAVVMEPDGLATLRKPFPDNQVHQLPKGGAQLDYVGHADVTNRLLDADPGWNWEPVAFGADGLPVFVRTETGKPIGLWIRLTVCGVTRLGYGSVMPTAFDAEKQLIGDALRNAAMRFGVALDLWSKSELHEAHEDGPVARHNGQQRAKEPVTSNDIGENWKALPALMQRHGLTSRELAPVLGGKFSQAALGEYLADPEHTLGTLISAAGPREGD